LAQGGRVRHVESEARVDLEPALVGARARGLEAQARGEGLEQVG